MEQRARVKVAGTPRAVLAAATGALVALTSGATAFVVLTGTAAVVRPGPSLMPLPPFAAPADQPVVLLPPAALGAAPRDAGRSSSATGGTTGTTDLALAQPRQRQSQLSPRSGRSAQPVELPPLAPGRVAVLPALTPASRPLALPEVPGRVGDLRGVPAPDSGPAADDPVEVVQPVDSFLLGLVDLTEQAPVAALRVGPAVDAVDAVDATEALAVGRLARADRPHQPARVKPAKAQKRAEKGEASKARKPEKARKSAKPQKPGRAHKPARTGPASKPQKSANAQPSATRGSRPAKSG